MGTGLVSDKVVRQKRDEEGATTWKVLALSGHGVGSFSVRTVVVPGASLVQLAKTELSELPKNCGVLPFWRTVRTLKLPTPWPDEASTFQVVAPSSSRF